MAALVVALVIMQLNSCDKQENLAQAYKAMEDSLHHSHDKYGHLITSTAAIELENKTFRKDIVTKDSTIKELQKVAQKYKGDLINSTIVTISTKEKGVVKGVAITHTDTVTKHHLAYLYPTYSASVNQPWGFNLHVEVSKDHMIYNVEMLNRMEFITRYQRKRFIAAKEPVIDVITYNPNTGVQELKTYIPKQPKRHLGLKIAGGILGGFIFGKLVH